MYDLKWLSHNPRIHSCKVILQDLTSGGNLHVLARRMYKQDLASESCRNLQVFASWFFNKIQQDGLTSTCKISGVRWFFIFFKYWENICITQHGISITQVKMALSHKACITQVFEKVVKNKLSNKLLKKLFFTVIQVALVISFRYKKFRIYRFCSLKYSIMEFYLFRKMNDYFWNKRKIVKN